MQYINLLVSNKEQATLDLFSKEFFNAVGVSSFEERESGNYLDGRYFKGVIGSLYFTLSLSDEEDHKDLPYWIQVSGEIAELVELISLVDVLVQTKLMPAGFQCARIINLGKKDEQRIDY